MVATTTRLEPTPPAPFADAPAQRSRRGRGLVALSTAIAALLLLPLLFLIIEASQTGWSTVSHLLFRQLTATLLWNTVSLLVTVGIMCAIVGTAAAWCVERTDLPGRRVWAVLVVLPVAIPDFVVSFGWVSVAPSVQGFRGAVLVMTLALYPLVYLPVAASLRGSDPAQEEVARGLGLGPVATFFRVTLAECRAAILGGALIVALAALAEYGAFEILGFRTFTTTIFNEFHAGLDLSAACALSLVLVVICLIVLAAEARLRGRTRTNRSSRAAARAIARKPLGRAKLPVFLAFVALATLGLGVPVGTLVYWLVRGGSTTLPSASIGSATWHTAFYSACAAALSTALALPVALVAVRQRRRSTVLLERSTYIVQALPGLVIALAFVFFSVRYAFFLYQTPLLLVIAYAILFFPLALIAVKASVARAPVGLEDVARSLGRRPIEVLWRVTLPLVGPGLAAAFCLVFLSAVTELTATLILVPTGVHTLATEFWAYTTNLSYGAAAPYAALLVAIAALPTYVLGRWFERLPSRATS
jgi:iron(III) transport system permease protein